MAPKAAPDKAEKSTAKSERFAVYFPTPTSIDHVLLGKVLESLKAGRKSSEFLYAMAIRGWLQVLHGLTPHEREMQLRSMDLPQEILEEIRSAVPHPQMVGLPAEALTGATVAPVVAAPAATTAQVAGMSVPQDSRIGTISPSGGLS